jgi:hypothetical protein
MVGNDVGVENWRRGHVLTVWRAEKDPKRQVMQYYLFARRDQ